VFHGVAKLREIDNRKDSDMAGWVTNKKTPAGRGRFGECIL
jgi:hypothetical protein